LPNTTQPKNPNAEYIMTRICVVLSIRYLNLAGSIMLFLTLNTIPIPSDANTIIPND